MLKAGPRRAITVGRGPHRSIATHRLLAVTDLADQTNRHDSRGLLPVIRRCLPLRRRAGVLERDRIHTIPDSFTSISRNRNLPGWLVLLGAILQREVMPRAAYTLVGKQM